jgi:hypothetical protein
MNAIYQFTNNLPSFDVGYFGYFAVLSFGACYNIYIYIRCIGCPRERWSAPISASSFPCGCWCGPFAPGPHWSCCSTQPPRLEPKHRGFKRFCSFEVPKISMMRNCYINHHKSIIIGASSLGLVDFSVETNGLKALNHPLIVGHVWTCLKIPASNCNVAPLNLSTSYLPFQLSRPCSDPFWPWPYRAVAINTTGKSLAPSVAGSVAALFSTWLTTSLWWKQLQMEGLPLQTEAGQKIRSSFPHQKQQKLVGPPFTTSPLPNRLDWKAPLAQVHPN